MINKLDYWFLDVALEMSIGINSIVPDKYGFLDINRKPLDIDFLEMAEIMDKLFKQEYLCASKPYGISEGSTPGNIVHFIPSKDEILQALQVGSNPEITRSDGEIIEVYNNHFDFFLTPEGGRIWESVSFPHWDLHFQKYVNFEEVEDESYITCSSKETINEILAIEHLLDFGGLSIKPILNTLHWETITPLTMPYWKTFHSGYRAIYKIDVSDFNEEDTGKQSQELISIKAEVQKKYDNTYNNWYFNYFKNH
jgi:hypothetical protein